MTNSSFPNFPIDAVIPWVDGADQLHAAKLHNYISQIGGARPRAANPGRFYHSGELDYCVTSLLRFAPWIRTIFIVTDEQTPDLVEKLRGTCFEGRVKVVDHKLIFTGYEKYLPTFNSSSILSVLWRIPGLAEHFVFLNDDFALLRPVQPHDFFREDKVVLRGQWRIYSERLFHRRVKLWIKQRLYGGARKSHRRAGYLEGQELSAKMLGFENKYFQVPHNPHAWRVSTQREYFSQHPEVLDFNVSFKLRSPDQFIGEALAAHLELKKNSAVIDNRFSTLQLKPADQALIRVKRKLAVADDDENTRFVCTQNIENAPEAARKLIFEWLDARIGSLEKLLGEREKEQPL